MTQSVENVNLDYELRYAHIDGHTELDFVPNANKVITAGLDCEIRIWSLESESDTVESFTVDDIPYSILATHDRAYVALADNSVKSFRIDEPGENESMVCRFSSNATCLSFHPDKELLAIGAADFLIKLVNLVDQSTKIFEGHEGPILSIAIDPLRKYIASSSCDGSVYIFSLLSKAIEHKWLRIFSKSNDFENSPTLCRIAWEPKLGDCLAIPRENCVEIYKRNQWENPLRKISHSKIVGIFSIVTFSNDGELLAASTETVIAIWTMNQIYSQNFTPLAMLFNADNRITSLKFNPEYSKQLCCADNSGSLKIMKIRNQTNNEISDTDGKISQECIDELLADYDEMDDFSFQIEKENKQPPVIDNNIEQKIINIEDKNVRFDILNNDEAENSVDAEEYDISAIKSKYEPLIFGDQDEVNEPKSVSFLPNKLDLDSEIVIDGYKITGNDLLTLVRAPRYQAPIRQLPFQSGSTPVHYKNRFLVWNSVGIVYSHNSSEENSIDVEFHDSTFHHSIHMANIFNYTIADLSTSCLVLASNEQSEDELDKVKAKLFCLLFNSWDKIKEWTIELPEKELFDCITAGQTFIAALTNHRYVRIWTIGGIQTMIRSIDGPSINLSSFNNFLMILYHSASHHYEDGQSVACIALKVDHKGKTRNHLIPNPIPVSLSPKSTVYWAGFTDEGTPCIVDSDGIIRVYKTHFGNGWFPICSTKQHANGKSDNFFIIGLSEIQAQVRCIFCKLSRYPDTVPKPTITALPLQIPLCEIQTQKGQYEENYLRNRFAESLLKRLSLDGYDIDNALTSAEKSIVNSLLKLFALALGAEREWLALEIAKILPNSKALEVAVKYANQKNHQSLSMKLVEMIQENENEEEEDGNEINSDVELEELMTKKDADRLRQILKDTDDTSNMILLPKLSTSTEYTTLKPKSLKKNKSSEQIKSRIETEVSSENEDIEDDVQCLKPKNLPKFSSKEINPFKIARQNFENNLKRKQIESDSD